MIWLILSVFAILLVGTYLNDDLRKTMKQVDSLAMRSRHAVIRHW